MLTLRRRVLFAVLFSTLTVSSPSPAQNPGYQVHNGTPGYGSFIASDIDAVNLARGGLTIRIPLFSRQGRGFDTVVAFGYQSKIWVAIPYVFDYPGGGVQKERLQWQPYYYTSNDPQPGIFVRPGGFVDFNEQVYTCVPSVPNWPPAHVTISSNWRYVSSDGASYGFPVRKVQVIPPAGFPSQGCYDEADYEIVNTPQLLVAPSATGGMKLDISNYVPTEWPYGGTGPVKMWLKDGTVLNFSIAGGAGGQFATDTNGNQCCANQSGWLHDSLGRPVLGGSQFYDSDGQLRNVIVTWTSLQINTAFPTGNVPWPYEGFDQWQGSMSVPQSVTIPNGQSGLTYTFSYEDPDNPSQTNPYGEVTKITSPTGGYIKYKWATLPQRDRGPVSILYGTEYYLDSRVVVERRVSEDGVNENVWTYSYSGNTSVTDPEGNVQVHTFSGELFLETQVEYRQGSTTPLRRVNTDWAWDSGPTTSQQLRSLFYNDVAGYYQGVSQPRNPRVIRVTTTLLDTNQLSEVETDYADCYSWPGYSPPLNSPQNYTDCPGNPTQIREYGWGTGSPGPLVRTTTLSYLHQTNTTYRNAHIWDRFTEKKILDAGGNVKAWTQFSYDTTAIAPTSGVPNHNYTSHPSTFTIRGNQTLLKLWRNTDGAWLVTTNYFNDVGNLTETTDPGGHAATFSYVDNYTDGVNRNSGAYVTQVTYPATGGVAHIQKKQHFWHTGLVAGTCGQNFSGACTNTLTPPQPDYARFAYDMLGRPLTVLTGDGGQTTYSYTEPSSPSPANPVKVTTTTKMTATQNVVGVATIDGLGRVKRTEQCEDGTPACNPSIKSDVTYDPLGRKLTVTNPYRSTSDPTYGITKFKYDALGRTIRVIPPDGNESADTNVIKTDYSGTSVIVADQAGKQRRSVTDALGRLIEVHEPGGGGPATPGTGSAQVSGILQGTGGSAAPGTGSATVNGSLQSIAGGSATAGTASVNITGSEQSIQVQEQVGEECVMYEIEGGCIEWQPIYEWVTYWDEGGVSVTVNGFTKNVWYGYGSTGASLATALAGAFNADGASPVTASASGTVVYLTSKVTGAVSNYPLSATSWTDDPAHFSGPSFVPVRSGPTLTGGADAAPTIYDSGSVWVTVNGQSKTVNYGQGSTTSSVAAALAGAMGCGGGYPVSASLSGSTLTLTACATGAGTNYSLSAGSSTAQPGNFSQPSFTVSLSGSTLTGGGDGSPYDAGTVSITVNGAPTGQFVAQVNYGQGSTSATVAGALRAALNAANSPVTAGGSDTSISITAKATGASSNYSLSGSSSSTVYPSPSFSVATSGLTGGADYTPGTLATPAVTTYTYDALDNLTQVVQSGSRQRTFTYNSLSQLLTASNPESGAITYTYDNDGNLITKTDARGISTTHAYDGLHRLTQKSYSDGTPLQTLMYDTGSGYQINMVGRLSRSCWEGTYVNCDWFGYDPVGRVTRHEQGGGLWPSTLYTYNLAGNVTDLGYYEYYTGKPTRWIRYSYDTAGRVNRVEETSPQPKIHAESILYHPHGAWSSMTLSNGTMQQSAAYNNRLQPTSKVVSDVNPASTIMNFTYSFVDGSGKNNGNVVSMWDNVQVLNYGFQYDELNRLARAETINSTLWGNTYGYDIWGNLYAKNQIAGKQQGEYFQQSVSANNQFAGWSYDVAGNLLNDGVHNYQYDPEGRMRCMDAGANCSNPAASYVYSVEGRRVKRTVGGATTLYLHDAGSVLSEFSNLSQGVGTWQKDYIYLNGALLATESATEGARYHFSDHLGTPRVITDAAGNVISRHDYYPFGKELTAWSDGETHKFTGHERDPESGLDYMMARYYSSTQGRFLSPDPENAGAREADPQSWNGYTYARNNPIIYTDPEGLEYRAYINGGGSFVANTYGDLQMVVSGMFPGATGVLSGDDKRGVIKACPIGEACSDVGSYEFFFGPVARQEAEDKVLRNEITGTYNLMADVAQLFVSRELERWAEANARNAEEAEYMTGLSLLLMVTPGPGGKGRAATKAVNALENHHWLVRQFRKFFARRSLDIEEYTEPMSRSLHRGAGGSMHGRLFNLNKRWKQWTGEHAQATRKQVLRQLRNLKEQWRRFLNEPQ